MKQSKASKLLCAYDFGKESDIIALKTHDTGITKLPLNHLRLQTGVQIIFQII